MRIALALPCLLACSDGASTTDATTNASADAYDTARCLITGNYGALGALTGTAGTMGGTTATITLDPGPPRDTLFVKMVAGRGAFTGGLAPGTFTIGGVDAQYLNCGMCVHIIADIVAGTGPSKFYFADSGTVTMTSTAPPIAGSAQDLHLTEVDINSGQAVANGCQATIASISFSTP